ncbi:cell wall integrity and stress response component [Microdochium nivale]|nr:cell wall integrity and stress response component [Microdochium nivale]
MVSISRRLLLLAAAATAAVTGATVQSTTAFSSGAATTTLSTATKTSSQLPATFTVRVGLQHDFQPSKIMAKKGDVIHFDFFPKNHSVVRAEFKNPCIPYDVVNPSGAMFFSGMKQSQPGDEPPSWELTVNDTAPAFFYCSAPGSCINWAMIGVINPNSTHNLDIQKQYQELATFQLSPGEPFPDEHPPSITPTNPAIAPTLTPTSTTPQASSGAQSSGSGSGLSTGTIAGIAIGGAAVLLIAIALIYFCGRKGGIEKGYRQSVIPPTTASPMTEHGYRDSYKPSTSPIPPTSPYGAQSDTWRSSLAPSNAPSQFSPNMASPHDSFMAQPGYGQQVYGFPAQGTGHSAELNASYDPPRPAPLPEAPAELPGTAHMGPRYASYR